MEGADLPAQMEEKLSEFLALTGGVGVKGQWKNNFLLYMFAHFNKVKDQTNGPRVMPGWGCWRRGKQQHSLFDKKQRGLNEV